MAKPHTVSELLAIVRQQGETIRVLTEALSARSATQRTLPLVQPALVSAPLPHEVEMAIMERAGTDVELREYLEQYAWEAMALGKHEQLVAQEITQGVQD